MTWGGGNPKCPCNYQLGSFKMCQRTSPTHKLVLADSSEREYSAKFTFPTVYQTQHKYFLFAVLPVVA
ncbi:hypothetical protein RIF29_18107 [Crotalaria pallida]|uniref:Uncharacterized protein n=1 Tax=Crotalaria pallida TaxID=3830 RepID=A0AAN9FQ98_CROPI